MIMLPYLSLWRTAGNFHDRQPIALSTMESKEVSMERQIIESKLLATREELSKAGPIHARDLQKYIHRLEKQLRILNKVTKE